MISVIDTKAVVTAAARVAFGNAAGCPLLDGTRQVGVLHESADAYYCYLDELVPEDVAATPGDQTRSIFRQIEDRLEKAGMKFENLVRTWFFLHHILDWYDEFNQARTPFLKEHGILEKLVPASTGVGMANRFGAAGVAGALAIKPKNNRVCIVEVESPLQCPALDYRSTFSRAVEVVRDGHLELYISGTASIEPCGKTAFLNDVPRQIDLSMQVVAAILRSRCMDWQDCRRAIGYVKDVQSGTLVLDYLREQGLETLPLTLMHADICRDDLLFEIELEAAK